MAITKTNFINYSRCPRYVALDDIKHEKLNSMVIEPAKGTVTSVKDKAETMRDSARQMGKRVLSIKDVPGKIVSAGKTKITEIINSGVNLKNNILNNIDNKINEQLIATREKAVEHNIEVDDRDRDD